MNIYKLVRPLLFVLPPETAHAFVLKSLNVLYRCRVLKPKTYPGSAIKILGMHFPNRIGLAAGFDRSGEYIDALSTLGFGFIEIGTITPKPQQGKPKPRIFRLPKQRGLINRVGFANKGVDYTLAQLQKTHYRGILGINIGKNPDTPNELAIEDYICCMQKLYPYANYLSINVSSPNTEQLRDLQCADELYKLLSTLKAEQHILTGKHHRYVPLFVKLSPDLTESQIAEISKVLQICKIDGVLLTNTSTQRPLPEHCQLKEKQGGLSGQPITEISLDVLKSFTKHLQQDIPIIALGGICDEKSAYDRIASGASLLEIYTGLIYQGPSLIKRLATFMK